MPDMTTESAGVHSRFQGTPAERVAHLKGLRDRVATSKYHLQQMEEAHAADRRELAHEQPKPEHGQIWIDLKGIMYMCAYLNESYHMIPLNAKVDSISFAYSRGIIGTGVTYYGCSLHELDIVTLMSLEKKIDPSAEKPK
jgi:hypothetical protein